MCCLMHSLHVHDKCTFIFALNTHTCMYMCIVDIKELLRFSVQHSKQEGQHYTKYEASKLCQVL